MLVICSGMFRSGSTLQYNLTRNYLARTVGRTDLGPFGKVDIECMLREFGKWADAPTWYILKCHDLIQANLWSEKSDKLSILYVYRDLREVGPSLRRVFGGTEQEIGDQIAEAIDVHEYVKGLFNAKIQRYEQLSSDPANGLREICQFLKLSIDERLITDVAQSLSIDRMREISDNLDQSLSYKLKLKAWNIKNRARIGNLLRRILPASTVRKARRLIVPHDRATKLFPNHISNVTEIDTQELSYLRDSIDARFADWLAANGYCTADGHSFPPTPVGQGCSANTRTRPSEQEPNGGKFHARQHPLLLSGYFD